jgi:hypothetical protein
MVVKLPFKLPFNCTVLSFFEWDMLARGLAFSRGLALMGPLASFSTKLVAGGIWIGL